MSMDIAWVASQENLILNVCCQQRPVSGLAHLHRMINAVTVHLSLDRTLDFS